jgi:hypothetical protein
METAESVANDILGELIINGAQQSIKAFDFNVAVRYMNRYMAQLDADGIALGYTIVKNAADPITIPLGAINGLIYNTALQIAHRYDSDIGPDLAVKAEAALNTMRKIAVRVSPSSYPDTLPIGSGNEWETNSRWNKFYPVDPNTIDSEINGVLSPEDGTIDD